MKTSMQELIDDLKELKKDSKERNQDTSFDIGMTFAIARAELRLEKEKEQMLDFGLYVKKNGWVGCKIEDLYEDYNNQNK
jgi:hypothetical protein